MPARAAPKVDRLPSRRYLGLDEITLVNRGNPAKAYLREARAVLVNLESENVLALLDDVRAETIVGWFATLSMADRARPHGVAIDMSRSYACLHHDLRQFMPEIEDCEAQREGQTRDT